MSIWYSKLGTHCHSEVKIHLDYFSDTSIRERNNNKKDVK